MRYADRGSVSYAPKGPYPLSEPDYLPETGSRAGGWSELSGVYLAPPGTAQATVKLHYRWEPGGKVEWSDVVLAEAPPPAPRLVRLATVNLRPEAGTTPAEKREQFAPFIAQAAKAGADLVVLPETLTIFGKNPDYASGAEPIPGGPSVRYFGELARRYHLYIVAGLVERDGNLIYNTAALIGPDGKLVGKYRKVTLPRGRSGTPVLSRPEGEILPSSPPASAKSA